ncbi:MAG: hypothetical protein ABIN05_01445 [candidate division WOR-3 bacterium]
MEFNLFIKCIFDNTVSVDKEFFEKIYHATTIDVYTLKQKFIGKGWAILRRSENRYELEKIKDSLNSINIKSVVLSDHDIDSIEVIEVSSFRNDNQTYEFFTEKGKITISKDDSLLFLAGIDKTRIENVSFKKLLLQSNFEFYLYSLEKKILLKFQQEKINYTNLKNFSKYSKSENFFKFYESLKNFSSVFFEDLNYSENFVEDLFFDFKTYSMISSLLFEEGLYSFEYEQKYIDRTKVKENNNLVYEFKYNIYKPNDLIFKKRMSTVKKFNLFEIFFIPFGIVFFLILIIFRIEKMNLLPYVFLGGVIYYLVSFIKVFKLKVFLESIPFSKLESISVGINEIKGFITDEYSIPSPISGTKCVYFHYKKFKKVKDSEGKTKWQLEHIGEYLPEKFIVQDEHGNRISVKTENATFNLKNKTVYTKTFYKFFSTEESGDVKYEEEILPVMGEVFVVGSVVNKDYMKEKNEFIKNKKLDLSYMKNFDLNRDNKIDYEEWEKAKLEMERDFDKKVMERRENENLEMVYSKDDKILFISDFSEKTFLKYSNIFLISSLVMITIFIILIIFSFGGF